jgi:hypothetical protein
LKFAQIAVNSLQRPLQESIMRLTIIALALLPSAALSQSAPQSAPSQSCPVGMVWNADAQNCMMAANGSSPLEGLSDHVGCKGDAAREVTS